MKSPIIELRQWNLFVLTKFGGTFNGGTLVFRHNFADNLTKYVVDSTGELWTLEFTRTDHVGIRKVISGLSNISSDYYTYTKSAAISVGEFRRIVEPYLRMENPDSSELAASLLEPLAQCQATDVLREKMHLLNL